MGHTIVSLQQNPVPMPPQGLTEVYTRAYQMNPPQGFMSVGDIALNPAQIPNLSIWLDASDTGTITTAIGNAVSGWADKSGNNIDAVQLTVVDQPETNVETLNGLNVITYTDDFMSIPFAVGKGINPLNFTTFAVGRVIDPQVSAGGMISNLPGFVLGGFSLTEGTRFFSFVGNEGLGTFEFIVSTRVTIANEWSIMSMEHTQAPLTEQYVDNFFEGPLSTVPVGYTATRDMELGTPFVGDPSERLTGAQAEIIQIERKITPSERNSIFNYLSAKWSVP